MWKTNKAAFGKVWVYLISPSFVTKIRDLPLIAFDLQCLRARQSLPSRAVTFSYVTIVAAAKVCNVIKNAMIWKWNTERAWFKLKMTNGSVFNVFFSSFLGKSMIWRERSVNYQMSKFFRILRGTPWIGWSLSSHFINVLKADRNWGYIGTELALVILTIRNTDKKTNLDKAVPTQRSVFLN